MVGVQLAQPIAGIGHRHSASRCREVDLRIYIAGLSQGGAHLDLILVRSQIPDLPDRIEAFALVLMQDRKAFPSLQRLDANVADEEPGSAQRCRGVQAR